MFKDSTILLLTDITHGCCKIFSIYKNVAVISLKRILCKDDPPVNTRITNSDNLNTRPYTHIISPGRYRFYLPRLLLSDTPDSETHIRPLLAHWESGEITIPVLFSFRPLFNNSYFIGDSVLPHISYATQKFFGYTYNRFLFWHSLAKIKIYLG